VPEYGGCARRWHHLNQGVGRTCENRPLLKIPLEIKRMDVEHINAIGNALTDLAQRTVDLRGYL
jgi:hypothetical protein